MLPIAARDFYPPHGGLLTGPITLDQLKHVLKHRVPTTAIRRGTAPNPGMFAQRLTNANFIPSAQKRRRNLEITVAANPKLEVANTLEIRRPSLWSRRRASPGHDYPELLDVPVLNTFAHKPRRERTSMNSCWQRSSGSPHLPPRCVPPTVAG